jgi:cation transport ATPase
VKGYPRRFLPSLIGLVVALTVSGALLVPTALELRFGWDVAWRLPGQQRLWVAGLHTAAALLICAFIGALWSIHVRVGWRSRRHLRSGLATIGLLGGAALTTLGVFYVGDESWLVSASAAHILLGTGSTILVAVHWGVSILERARRREPIRSAMQSQPTSRAAGV